MKFPWYKIICSYVYPISIEKRKSERNNNLEISLYKNQVVLATPSAIYSQGLDYTPFLIPLNKIKKVLSKVDTFLLLGAGLGSALIILQKKMNCFPQATLVDADSEIISIGQKYAPFLNRDSVQWICSDAIEFVQTDKSKYDLIGIDVFYDMFVPHQITDYEFLKNCKNRLSEKGFIIMNFVAHDDAQKQQLELHINELFNKVSVISNRQNLIYILQA